MKRTKICLFIICITLFGCESIEQRMMNARIRDNLKTQKYNFEEYCVEENLFDVFPRNLSSKKYGYFASPPSVTEDCKRHIQWGIVTLKSLDKSDEGQNYNSDHILYEADYYSAKNCIIYLGRSAQLIDTAKRYNVFEKGLLPVPCFEMNYIFSDSVCNRMEVNVDDDQYVVDTYYVPSDLQVHVVDARAGNFWKNDCNEYRPESLKEWKHGYSKGFATSEKENIIVYWTMIW